jgi:hypothetical protein
MPAAPLNEPPPPLVKEAAGEKADDVSEGHG